MTKISALISAPPSQPFHNLRSHLHQQDDIELVGQAIDESQTLLLVRALQPAVLLLDAQSAATGGMAVLAKIRLHSPMTKVVMACAHCTDEFTVRALEHGARGCLPTASPPEQYSRAIRAVHAGEFWVGRKVLAHLLAALLTPLHHAHARDAYDELRDRLSDRESEIVFWMQQGMSNKEIGRKLRISDTTVKTHVHNIFHKLKVSGRLRLFQQIDRRGAAPISVSSPPDLPPSAEARLI